MGRLVLIGGGHAHAGVLFHIGGMVERGHEVVLVNPTPQHYYSGMGPGVLGGAYTPEQIRFPVKDMVLGRGGKFIEDRLESVDADARVAKLASGEELAYDVLSFNAGSVIPTPRETERGDDIFTVKPIQNLWIARERIEELLDKGAGARGRGGRRPSGAGGGGQCPRGLQGRTHARGARARGAHVPAQAPRAHPRHGQEELR